MNTFDGAMDTKEILDTLHEQHEKRAMLDENEALESPVDYEEFVKFAGSVENVQVGRGEFVRVQFLEPVPSALLTAMKPGYRYNIAVSPEGDMNTGNAYNRHGMPRDSLLTLQQVAIVVWVMATGAIY